MYQEKTGTNFLFSLAFFLMPVWCIPSTNFSSAVKFQCSYIPLVNQGEWWAYTDHFHGCFFLLLPIMHLLVFSCHVMFHSFFSTSIEYFFPSLLMLIRLLHAYWSQKCSTFSQLLSFSLHFYIFLSPTFPNESRVHTHTKVLNSSAAAK